MIRALIAERADPVLFELSYDYVGDLSETVALMWPADPAHRPNATPSLSDVDRNAVHARQVAASRPARALARRAGRDRPLGAAQARHRRACASASRRGSPRPRRPRSATTIRTRSKSSGPGLRRLTSNCSPGWKAAPTSRSAPIPRRSVRRCWRMPSRRPISPRSIPPTFPPNGNGTAPASRRSPGVGEDGKLTARLYSRTGEDISKSFPELVDALRLPGAIDGELLIVREGRVQSFNVLQQRLNRKAVNAEADRRISRPHPRLRSAGRRHRRSARAAVRRAPRAAGEIRRAARRSAHRHLAAGAVRDLGRAHRGARRSGVGRRGRRCRRGRRHHAQAPRQRLRARPSERPVVEMEARPDDRRRGADVCAARPRQTLVVLFRLHLRRLDQGRERRRAGAGRQGLFRLHRRGAAADRPLRAPQHHRPLRPGARSDARAATRAWCWKSRSRACSARPGTSPASPCGFPASAGCAGTSRRARPTGWKRWSRCWKASSAGGRRSPIAETV